MTTQRERQRERERVTKWWVCIVQRPTPMHHLCAFDISQQRTQAYACNICTPLKPEYGIWLPCARFESVTFVILKRKTNKEMPNQNIYRLNYVRYLRKWLQSFGSLRQVVAFCTTRFNIKNSALCPQSAILQFLWI